MSFVICQECKYVQYCTFPSTGRVDECDEYEDRDSAPSYDWNLKDMLKLWLQDNGETQAAEEG